MYGIWRRKYTTWACWAPSMSVRLLPAHPCAAPVYVCTMPAILPIHPFSHPTSGPKIQIFYIIFQVIYISLVFSHTKSSYKNLYWYKSILPSTKSTGRPKYHFSHSVFETPLFPTVTPATHNI